MEVNPVYIFPDDTLQQVEFSMVREWVAEWAVSDKAKERILSLIPSSDRDWVLVELERVNEFLAIYQTGSHFPALAAPPIDDSLKIMRVRNAVLEAEKFMQIKDLVDSFNRLHKFFESNVELLFSSQELFKGAVPNTEIPVEIDRVFERNGEVKTSASPELQTIRTQLVRKRQSADRIFYKALKKHETSGVLGDFRESVQDGRRVLAVNAAYKTRVNGIFHGSSNKNSLYFVEPGEAIEINNEVAYLVDQERKEIRRILQKLTAFMSAYADELTQMAEVVVDVDYVHAKAKYAFKNDGSLPKISQGQDIHIMDGKNPVLLHFNEEKHKGVVPLNVTLTKEARILVISGPNAGGKSITLKTIGLFQIMLQSGLLLPLNPKSTLGFYDQVFADIGDAQSIENELSTYSSKLEKMKVFLDKSHGKTLVLIDEFGSGSDPELGSALAQVFLEQLNQSKIYGVITTHYNGIKALASQLPGVVNGSMLFNLETFRPEYILHVGTPGSSYTFEVAEKSGMGSSTIKRAKAKLKAQTTEVDKLLVSIHQDKKEIAEFKEKVEQELEDLQNLKEVQEAKIASLEAKVEKQSTINEEQNRVLQWGKRFEGLVNKWMKDQKAANRKAVISTFVKLLNERSGQVVVEKKVEEKKKSSVADKLLAMRLEEPIVVGDKVKLLNSHQNGEVVSIKGNKYEVNFGLIKSTLERGKFVKAKSSISRADVAKKSRPRKRRPKKDSKKS